MMRTQPRTDDDDTGLGIAGLLDMEDGEIAADEDEPPRLPDDRSGFTSRKIARPTPMLAQRLSNTTQNISAGKGHMASIKKQRQTLPRVLH